MVYVLGLCNSFKVIFKDFCKVVLQLRTTEIVQNFLPIWLALRNVSDVSEAKQSEGKAEERGCAMWKEREIGTANEALTL